MQQLLTEQGTEHQTTVVYDPQQNGIAERKNRTLVDMVRCILDASLLDQLLSHTGTDVAQPILMHEDNQSCIHLSKQDVNLYFKHINIKYHLVRDLQKGVIKLTYCPMKEMIAVAITKPLSFSHNTSTFR